MKFVGWIYGWYGFWFGMRQFWYIMDVSFHIKVGLILIMDLSLYIKLSLDYGKLSLDLMKFILVYQILGLVDCVYILVINLKILDQAYNMWNICVELYLLIQTHF